MKLRRRPEGDAAAGTVIGIAHEGAVIPCEVVRSDRRTLALTVGADGAVRARAPWRMPLAEIERFARSKAAWVARKRAETAERERKALAPLSPAEIEQARTLFSGRYRACWDVFGQPGETMPPLRVRTMRSRWGSLAPSGRVTLNAHLVRAPAGCLDYVIFHELCHVRVRGHGASFYAELERYVPGWRDRRSELRGLL